ncbi:hypothetical protein [Brucella anthropi]|uniref:hypothetical protein n=1 Tax=Brucella anthropi TaxID=529 RepID=UPI00124EB734|nr:hypothetical protein [Brucella anthropi]KAB2751808.1 hypothetical protein F9L05_01350 [Brucella anthropi]DAU40472.1 MAG TPA: hypothetical protein [Caudoviricetes sp.]
MNIPECEAIDQDDYEDFPDWGLDLWVTLDDATVLKGVVMLDAMHQTTDSMSTTTHLICIDNKSQWYILTMADGCWRRFTVH